MTTTPAPAPPAQPAPGIPPYARLADIRAMEEQLRAAGHGTRVRVALAKGRGKRAVERDFQEQPLTEEQAQEFDGRIAQDLQRPSLATADRHHFVLLPAASHPPLVVLDFDSPAAPLTKEAKAELEEASAWLSNSSSKGFHAVLLQDRASLEVTRSAAQVPLRAATARATAAGVGEVHTRYATAYRPLTGGQPLTLSDLPRLYTTLTGKTRPPSGRVRDVVQDALAEMAGWEDLVGGGNKRWLRFQGVVKRAARRLKTTGILPGSETWKDCANSLCRRFAEVKPDKRMTVNEVLDSMAWAFEHSYNAESDGEFDIIKATWEEVLAEHDGEVHIERRSLRDVQEGEVTVWVAAERTWRRHNVSQAYIASDGVVLTAFNDLVRRKIVAVSRDAGLKEPTEERLSQTLDKFWKAKASSSASNRDMNAMFDYQKPKPEGNDVGYEPPREMHYYCGRGEVVRIGLTAEEVDSGTVVSIQPNRPEYRTRASLPHPAAEESALAWRTLREIFPEDGVVDYIIDMVALALLPREWHEDRFLQVLGDGSNGKSSAFQALAHALGDHAVTLNFSAIKKQAGSDPRQLGERGRMVGKRLIVLDETDRDRVDEPWFKNTTAARSKSAIGGMYKENVERHIDGLIVILSNEELNMSATDASRRRAALVSANRRFEGAEQKSDLGDQLAREAPGILRMILNRVPSVVERKIREPRDFPHPTSMEMRREAWLTNQNTSRALLRHYFLRPEVAAVGAQKVAEGDRNQSHDDAPLAWPAGGEEAVPLIARGQSGLGTGLAGVAAMIKRAEDNLQKPRTMVVAFLQSVGQSVGLGRGRNLCCLVPTNGLVHALVDQEIADERNRKAWDAFCLLFATQSLGAAKELYQDAFDQEERHYRDLLGGRTVTYGEEREGAVGTGEQAVDADEMSF